MIGCVPGDGAPSVPGSEVAQVSGYRRPASLDEALMLLERPGTVVIGGGTKVNAEPTAEPIVVVDLQALGLSAVGRIDGDLLRIGATVTLQQLVECGDVPAVIREAAQREEPSTLRAQATIGGSIVTADPESELLATLLVHDAVVSLAGAAGPEEAAHWRRCSPKCRSRPAGSSRASSSTRPVAASSRAPAERGPTARSSLRWHASDPTASSGWR